MASLFARNPFAAPEPSPEPAKPTRDEIAETYVERGASLQTARDAATSIMRPANDRTDSDHRALDRVGQEIHIATCKRLGDPRYQNHG